jgi:hypothetical protein
VLNNSGTIQTTSTASGTANIEIDGTGLPLGRVNLKGGGTLRLGAPAGLAQNSFLFGVVRGRNADDDISGEFFSADGVAQLVNHDNVITGNGGIGAGLDFIQNTNGVVLAQNGQRLLIRPYNFAIAGGGVSSFSFEYSRYLTNMGLMAASCRSSPVQATPLRFSDSLPCRAAPATIAAAQFVPTAAT